VHGEGSLSVNYGTMVRFGVPRDVRRLDNSVGRHLVFWFSSASAKMETYHKVLFGAACNV
jgi:hypothetical protein